jgi:hypothetical protein
MNMEDFYELYDMNDLVIVHPYDGDMDEHILEEVRPIIYRGRTSSSICSSMSPS